MDAYEDPNHEGNSAKYHTKFLCIEDGCENTAGTKWSPHWCFKCNVKRIKKLDEKMKKMTKVFNQKIKEYP